MDAQGRVVYRAQFGTLAAGPHDALLPSFAPGVYVVRVTAGAAVAASRFVVVR